MQDVYEGKEDQWGDLEVRCHIFFFQVHSNMGAARWHFLVTGLTISHTPAQMPLVFPEPWAVVLSLPALSPSPPLGTNIGFHFLHCLENSSNWAFSRLMIPFLSLSCKCSHHPPPDFPNTSCLYCPFGLVSHWHDFSCSCWSWWLVCILSGLVLSLL